MNLEIDRDKVFNPGEFIFIEGDSSEEFYIIKKGRVLIFKRANERIIPLGILGEKDFLGVEDLILQGPRQYFALAREQTSLTTIPKKDLEKFFAISPDWVSKIIKTLSFRLQKSRKLIADNQIVDDITLYGDHFTPEAEAKIQKLTKF